jgi:hypothetical protein
MENERKFNCKLFDSIRTWSLYALRLRIKSKIVFRYQPPINFLVRWSITWSIGYFQRQTSKEQIIYIYIHYSDIYYTRCVGDTVGWAVYIYREHATDKCCALFFASSKVTRVLTMEIDDGLYIEISFDPLNAWSDVHIL